MTGPGLLAQLVSATEPAALLPNRSGTATTGVAHLTLLDHLVLGPNLAVLVVVDHEGGLHVVPAVHDGSGVRRAVAGDGLAEALIRLLVGRPGGDGRFVVRKLHGRVVSGERAMGVDQTNESLVVGETAVVKWLNHVSSDLHPAPGRLSLLDAAGFTSMPQPWGFLFWRDDDDRDVLLVAVDQFLPSATNGWSWCVDDVRRLVRGELTMPDSLVPPATVGAMVASMHSGFASAGVAVADPAERSSWYRQALSALDAAVVEVDGPEGERLRRRAGEIRDHLRAWESPDDVMVLAVHGDLHVGQVLRYQRADGDVDYAVTDFDGNPVLTAGQRTAPQPAARDVAGYLQSLDHVGRVVVRRTAGVDAGLVGTWITKAQSSFLGAYIRGMEEAGLRHAVQERLLSPLRVEQECREYLYAVRYDPVWRYVPDAAMGALLESLRGPRSAPQHDPHPEET
ncbi:MAG: aminoglycoside phosphotransferase [Actinomycetes bacterium]